MGLGVGGAPGSVDQDLSLRDGVEIYFARQDGQLEASLKAQAKDPSSASTSLSIPAISGLTLNPGDIVMVSGRGGVITSEVMTPAVSGIAGKPLRLLGEKTVPPVITLTGNKRALHLVAVSYWDVGFFPDCSHTGGDFGSVVQVFGPAIGVNMESVHVTRNRNAGGTASQDCFEVVSDVTGAPLTSHVVARNLAANDYKDGSTTNTQGFIAKDGSTFDVYGYGASNGNILASANGTDARTRLYDGFADNMSVRMGNADAGGVLEVHRSHILTNEAKPGSTAGCVVRFVNCAVDINDPSTLAIAGVLEFDGCRLTTAGGGRWNLNDPDAVWRFKNGVFLPGDSNFWQVQQTTGGSLQIENSLIDCSNAPAADAGVFFLNNFAANAGHYVRRSAIKDFNTLGLFMRIDGATGPSLDIQDVTAWNQTSGGTFLTNNRTDSGASVSITNAGFENLTLVSSSEVNTNMTDNGFFNAPSQGSNPVLGDPLLVDPVSDDFRNGTGSAWGDDIGVNQAYNY